MHRLEGALRVFVNFSAATFWAVGLTLLILLLSGAIPLERWFKAGRALEGELEMAEKSELDARSAGLRAASDRQDLWGSDQEPTFALLQEAVRDINEMKAKAGKEIAAEKTRLSLWHDDLNRRQNSMQQDIARWKNEREKSQKTDATAKAQARSLADARFFKIYNQMEAAQIAQDLMSQCQTGETDEAARILAGLSDRKAAEVLTEITDPVLRTRLINDMTTLIASQVSADEGTEVSQ